MWLGRDAHTGQSLPQPRFRGLDPDRVTELTRVAQHYGFHATLTPPFRLAERTTEAALLAALDEFAGQQRPFSLPPLELTELDNFFCLRPEPPLPCRCRPLASRCTREFDRFRAPLTPSELARRKAAQLNGQEKKNLEIWGYPYVFEQYRFHFTLTARMAEGKHKELVHAALIEIFRPAAGRAATGRQSLSLHRAGPGEPMRCLHRFRLPLTHPGHENASPMTSSSFSPRPSSWIPTSSCMTRPASTTSRSTTSSFPSPCSRSSTSSRRATRRSTSTPASSSAPWTR